MNSKKSKTQSKVTKNSNHKFTKQLTINLKRLTKNEIEQIIRDSERTITFNFSVKSVGSNWVCEEATKNVEIRSNRDRIELKFKKENTSTYDLRYRPQENHTKMLINNKPQKKTISEIGFATQKNTLWDLCKKKADNSKLFEGAIVFAKQKGYSPWPSKILQISKNRKTVSVSYFGFNDLKGSVKIAEVVQLNDESKLEIGELINFILVTKNIREISEFSKAISEIQGVMQSF